jgi:hypothetical protein
MLNPNDPKKAEDIPEAKRARDKAIDQVEANNEGWVHHAVNVIHLLCRATPWITADDVWRSVDYKPSHPCALGAAMCKAARLKYCERTDTTKNSARVANHHRPIRVWRSLIVKS